MATRLLHIKDACWLQWRHLADVVLPAPERRAESLRGRLIRREQSVTFRKGRFRRHA